MADGYYGYSPADYIKDYSWIGNIGQTIAQVAYKMPELVRYNRSVKENRQHNAENYGAVQEWVKWMQVEQPEVWNAVAKGYGVEPGQLAPILTKQIRAPGKGEENEKYSRALLNDFVVPMFNAGKQGGIKDDAFVRGISRMPRIAQSGERQGEMLKEYHEGAQQKKKQQREEAGRKKEQERRTGFGKVVEGFKGKEPFQEEVTAGIVEQMGGEELTYPDIQRGLGSYGTRAQAAAAGRAAESATQKKDPDIGRISSEVKHLRSRIGTGGTDMNAIRAMEKTAAGLEAKANAEKGKGQKNPLYQVDQGKIDRWNEQAALKRKRAAEEAAKLEPLKQELFIKDLAIKRWEKAQKAQPLMFYLQQIIETMNVAKKGAAKMGIELPDEAPAAPPGAAPAPTPQPEAATTPTIGAGDVGKYKLIGTR